MSVYKQQLEALIKSKSELRECNKHFFAPIRLTFDECLEVLTEHNLKKSDNLLLKINSVIDYLYDELNTGHWSKVPETCRQAFTVCSFLKALIIVEENDETVNILKEALKCIDLGLLLGAPLVENSDLLLNSASFLSSRINILTEVQNEVQIPANDCTKKRKYSQSDNINYEDIKALEISVVSSPSIESFNREFFQKQFPVKLTDCMSHWPAMKKWLDVNYLLKVAGNRTVPVEIGSHYADENWTQKLMTLQDFIKKHFFAESPESSGGLGYLAQHNLFDQISELRNDICIPDYCCISNDEDNFSDPNINAWFGPKNTVSPLHFDPKNNILAQVFGTKQLILFPPEDSEYLYPHEDKLLSNTGQVNPLIADLVKFPLFTKARMYKCLLNPGEMLFLPAKWWHHVTALEKSFSVSFWWE